MTSHFSEGVFYCIFQGLEKNSNGKFYSKFTAKEYESIYLWLLGLLGDVMSDPYHIQSWCSSFMNGPRLNGQRHPNLMALTRRNIVTLLFHADRIYRHLFATVPEPSKPPSEWFRLMMIFNTLLSGLSVQTDRELFLSLLGGDLQKKFYCGKLASRDQAICTEPGNLLMGAEDGEDDEEDDNGYAEL
ncbi:hypothetical protein BDR04DRAFT_1121406 [Suillus decipiens]|nr:hypothetical protein BDR04DRAFT_1121406 [Suillus decipiens]